MTPPFAAGRSGVWRRAPSVAACAIALLALLALAAEPSFGQCRMCRTALETPEGAALAYSFRRAILFLLAAPFVAVGVVALLVVRAHRASGPPPAPPAQG